MKYFKKIDFLPELDLYSEYLKLLTENKISFDPCHNQICLNSTVDDPNNFHRGTGSLYYDWKNKKEKINNEKAEYIELEKKENAHESDFIFLCDVFKGTEFEKIYNSLNEYYKIGRVRIMKSKPQTCLSWHCDDSIRLHYPLKTQEGCFMVIQNEIFHMLKHNWWETNTLVKHTAFNASLEERIHLVVSVLEKK